MRQRRDPPVGARAVPRPAGELRGRLSLARALSKLGVCSRKQAEGWIEAGRVRVGGRVVRFPQRRIDPRRDRLSVDGIALRRGAKRIVLVLHKPVGYITSRTDPAGRATVYDLLGDEGWVFPVGRLDRDTSGLLVLTNDHRLGQRLTDPEHRVRKTYHVRVRGLPDDEAVCVLREGTPLGDGSLTRPAQVRRLGAARGGSSWLEIVLTEGKNRQVRRMCAAVGHEVEELVRVSIGRVPLGSLAPGEWRRLDRDEIARLQEDAC